MNTDAILTGVGVVFCLVLSAGCIHYLILDPMDQQLKQNVQKQLDSPHLGPLDDAFADLAEVPRRKKPIDLGLPKAKPLNFDFETQHSDRRSVD